MSIKYLPTITFIEPLSPGNVNNNIMNGNKGKESSESSCPNIEFKSFHTSKTLQHFLSIFKVDSPRTREACHSLGINPKEFLLKIQNSQKSNENQISDNFIKEFRKEMQNTSFLRLFKEIFKKRKEIAQSYHHSKNVKKESNKIHQIPLKIYFRKRFYSPNQTQEHTHNPELDNLCDLERSFRKIKEKDQRKKVHLKRNYEKYKDFVHLQDKYKLKMDALQARLVKFQDSKDNSMKEIVLKREILFQNKKNILEQKQKESSLKIKEIANIIDEKQKKFDKQRTIQKILSQEQREKFFEKEKERNENVQIYQYEENMRLEERSFSILEKIKLKSEFSGLKIKKKAKKNNSEEKSKENIEKDCFQNILRKIVKKNEKIHLKTSVSPKENKEKSKIEHREYFVKENIENLLRGESQRILDIEKKREVKEKKIGENVKEIKKRDLLRIEKHKFEREDKFGNFQRLKKIQVFALFFIFSLRIHFLI